jgi:nucleoside-diphosphate-sugar epimerase
MVPAFLFRVAGKESRKADATISRLFDPYCFSSLAFKKAYSWHPPFTFQQGIEETVQWYLAARKA